MNLLALLAPARMGALAGDGDQFGRREEFDLLNDFGRLFAGHEWAMTIGTLGAVDFVIVDVGVVEGIAFVLLVPGLPAAFSFAAFGFRLGFLDEIGRRRLGRVG